MPGGGNRGHSRPLSAASNKGSAEAGWGGRDGSEPAAASGAAFRRPGSAKPSLPTASRTNSAGSVRPASAMSMGEANSSKMSVSEEGRNYTRQRPKSAAQGFIGPRFTIGMKEHFPFSGTRSKERAKTPEPTNRLALGGDGRMPEPKRPASAVSQMRSSMSKASFNQASKEDDWGAGWDDDDSLSIYAGSEASQEEKNRSKLKQELEEYTSLLPGANGLGPAREAKHLKRLLTSADNLAPVRQSLQDMGIDEIQRVVYQDPDPNKLIKLLKPDIHTGIWSCCRITQAQGKGCRTGVHTGDKFICMFCGAMCGAGERGGGGSCLYHPGTLQRSKAGGVWWSCCGAVGFQNSILHSSGGDINAPSSDWRWGCKKSPMHRPLQLFDYDTDPRKYVNCTQGPVRSSKRVGIEESNTVTASDDFLLESGAAVQCVRISSMTVYGQPLLPVILGMQLRYENVIRGEIFDSPKRMGDPGEIGEKDHLRRIVHETLEFRPDEYIEAVQGTVNELCYIELTVITNLGREHKFFEDWKNQQGEKSLRELYQDGTSGVRQVRLEAHEYERVVGFCYGTGVALNSLGILTRGRVYNDTNGALKRCTLCADFFFDDENETGACRYHPGVWTPQRRIRVPDHSTMPKCGSKCDAIGCTKQCTKFQHRSHVMTHSCGDTRCSEACSYEDCSRRCAYADHFHGTKDPTAAHDCGKPHPCHKLCACGKRCMHVSYRGEVIHNFHWCGSKEGCKAQCSVEGCFNMCSSDDHHHDLRKDCVHLCSEAHPCDKTCSAAECDQECSGDRAQPHTCMCNRAGELGCLCICIIDGCGRRCKEDDHFHSSWPDCIHTCGGVHPCPMKCAAKGCRQMCCEPRSEPHTLHRCQLSSTIGCADPCSVHMCPRVCANPDHFHGLEMVKDAAGRLAPKDKHLCDGFHLCPKRCSAKGCMNECSVDRAMEPHVCACTEQQGCKAPCEIFGCELTCNSQDHFHKGPHHICGREHHCQHECERLEPCVWEDGMGKSSRRRQKKTCGMLIPAFMARHEGPHDCCGKHEPPIAFDENDEPERCVQRCEKRGCRKRCKFGCERHKHTASFLAPPEEGQEPVHLCDQAMCLDVCPYPKCRRVCTLPHWHLVIDPESRCGCTADHRKYIPGVETDKAAQEEKDAKEAIVQHAHNLRISRIHEQQRKAKALAEGKLRQHASRPVMEPQVARASKASGLPGSAKLANVVKPKQGTAKYTHQYSFYSGFTPFPSCQSRSGEEVGQPVLGPVAPADEEKKALGGGRGGAAGGLSRSRTKTAHSRRVSDLSGDGDFKFDTYGCDG